MEESGRAQSAEAQLRELVKQLERRNALLTRLQTESAFHFEAVSDNSPNKLLLLRFGETLKHTEAIYTAQELQTHGYDLRFCNRFDHLVTFCTISIFPFAGCSWLRFGSVWAPITPFNRASLLTDLEEVFAQEEQAASTFSAWQRAVVTATEEVRTEYNIPFHADWQET